MDTNTHKVLAIHCSVATPAIIRRFRKELREQHEIEPEDTVVLQDEPRRSANVFAAKLLLEQAFNNRITVITDPNNGYVCGSREEAALNRLKQYTRQEAVPKEFLLAEVPAQDLNEFLKQQDVDEEVFVPESPEKRFFDTLADDFPSVRYGL